MVEATGRTRADALAKATALLGIPSSQVEIVLLEEKRQRFLGLFGGPVVRLRARRRAQGRTTDHGSDADRTGDIVKEILSAMGIGATISIESSNGSSRVQVRTDGSDGLLIGRHGQTLLALEHIANRILTKARDDRPVVPLDVGGYRSRGGEPHEEVRAASASRGPAGRRRTRRKTAGAGSP